MSGMCSAHRHYDRDCPRCQSEKPAWVVSLESDLAAAQRAAAEAQALAEFTEKDWLKLRDERDAAQADAKALAEALLRAAPERHKTRLA